MKPDKHKGRKKAKPLSPATPASESSRAGTISPGRQRRFKVVLVMLPFLTVALLELALRLGGYGYPTGFLVERQMDGKTVLIENQRFGWRFFSPELARTPEPLLVEQKKQPGTIRVVVLGESAAMGDPEPAYGLPRILEAMLPDLFPGQKVEVINAAMTAINSHAILPIARDCAKLEPDYWVIYMGNNEVVGPFGAGTVFGRRAPSLGMIRASLAFKTTKVGQLLEAVRQAMARGGQEPSEWAGMELFLNHQLRADDPRMAAVYGHFAHNLQDILEETGRSGGKTLVCSVAANLKDCAPFASLPRPDFGAAELGRWQPAVEEGAALAKASEFEAALGKYGEAAGLDGTHAELHYRIAECLWRLGRFESAGESYRRALDLDALRFRADSRLNEIARASCTNREGEGIYFVDAAKGISDASPHGIPGRELFWEHVHLNFEGNYLLARQFAGKMAELGPSQANAGSLQWPDRDEVAGRLALTDWDRLQVARQVRQRMELAPFNRQVDHSSQMQHLQETIEALEGKLAATAMAEQTNAYVKAMTKRPDDWVLAARLGGLLEELGDSAGAIRQWQKVIEQVPHHATAHFQAGNLLDKTGDSESAIPAFQEAVRLRPRFPEAYNGLGLAYLNLDRPDDAVAAFEKALRFKPRFPAAHVNLALALWRKGEKREAEEHFLAALNIQTNYAAAHINLGKLLREDGRTDEALAQYQAAVRVAPRDPVARLNLANTLLALNRREEALKHLEAAVEVAPKFTEARLALAFELARTAQGAAALSHFAEAVRLAPDDANARLNYGVALARGRQYPQAREQFEAAVRLNPADAEAHLNLAMVFEAQNDVSAAVREYAVALKLDPNNKVAAKKLEQYLRGKAPAP